MLQQRQLVGAELEGFLRDLPLPECSINYDPSKDPLTFRQRPFAPYSPGAIDEILRLPEAQRLEPESRQRVEKPDVIPAFCARNVFLIAARNAISNNRADFNQAHIQLVTNAIDKLELSTVACAEHYLEQFCINGEELYALSVQNLRQVVLQQLPAARERIFRDVSPDNPPSMAKLAELLDRNDPTIRYQGRLAGPGLQQPVARPQQAPVARPAVQPAPAQRPAVPAIHAAVPQPEVEALRAALAALRINVPADAHAERLIALGQAHFPGDRPPANAAEEEAQLQIAIVQAELDHARQNARNNEDDDDQMRIAMAENAIANAQRWQVPLNGILGVGPAQPAVRPPVQQPRPQAPVVWQAPVPVQQQAQADAARVAAQAAADRQRELERQRLAQQAQQAQAAVARAEADRQRVADAQAAAARAEAERQQLAEAARQRALLEQQQRAAAQGQFDAMFRAGDYPNVDDAQKRLRVIAAQGAPAVVPGFQQEHFLGLLAEELRQVDARIVPPAAINRRPNR